MDIHDSSQMLRNTKRNIVNDNEIKNVKTDFLTKMNLGHVVPTEKINNFDRFHGHPLNLHHPAPYLRPPNLDVGRPPAYILEGTKNKLVDVAGVYYLNKDLKTQSFK